MTSCPPSNLTKKPHSVRLELWTTWDWLPNFVFLINGNINDWGTRQNFVKIRSSEVARSTDLWFLGKATVFLCRSPKTLLYSRGFKIVSVLLTLNLKWTSNSNFLFRRQIHCTAQGQSIKQPTIIVQTHCMAFRDISITLLYHPS